MLDFCHRFSYFMNEEIVSLTNIDPGCQYVTCISLWFLWWRVVEAAAVDVADRECWRRAHNWILSHWDQRHSLTALKLSLFTQQHKDQRERSFADKLTTSMRQVSRHKTVMNSYNTPTQRMHSWLHWIKELKHVGFRFLLNCSTVLSFKRDVDTVCWTQNQNQITNQFIHIFD